MSKYNKFLLTKTKKGEYDLSNPITKDNLWELGGGNRND